MRLPETQVALLNAASATDERSIEEIAADVEADPTAVEQAAFELESSGLVSVETETAETVTLTAEGQTYTKAGLPELRLYRAAAEAGGEVQMGEAIGAAGLDGPTVDIALANFSRKELGSIDDGRVTVAEADPESDPEAVALESIADGETEYVEPAVLDRLESRGLIERTETTTHRVTLTETGVTALMEGIEVAETVGAVTPELLTSGEWADVEFAEYDVTADAETIHGGKEHILRQTANRVKDVLVGMGFQEMEGPHADADFWINDCLFMPQDHPARTHWDRFALDVPPMDAADLPDGLPERVESAHRNGVGEDGEGYHSPWSLDFARAIALRGHTTSLTTRHLSGEAVGDVEPPARYFSVEKVYRNDTLDPTHLLEFFQIEGWVMAEKLSVRDLMGTFTEFYEQFGITDLEFKPHYNPYTEPSFELFGTHPETGELIEVGNSGIFREEMLQPLGVEADVMAWGLSLERLLMLMYGFEDIRDVHGTLCDLELLRDVEVVR
ncbi:MAG: phenylalanine--tRNA ligase subunit alpha [Natronomonas sp.]